MAGKKAAAPAANEEFTEEAESEGWDDDGVGEIDPKTGLRIGTRLRDWRDVEKFREMRELRRLVDDDFGMEETFGAPPSARPEMPPRQAARKAPAERPADHKPSAHQHKPAAKPKAAAKGGKKHR